MSIEAIRRSENYQYAKKVAKKYFVAIPRDAVLNIGNSSEFRGAFDAVDRRDYDYEDFAGADRVDMAKFIDLSTSLSEVQNQGLTIESRYFCTAFSNSSGADMQDRETHDNFYNGMSLGRYMVNEGTMDVNAGAYTIDAVRANKAVGNITSYARVNSLESFKGALSNGRPIVVGSNKIDWRKTEGGDNIVVVGTSYGHLFCAVGYDDETKLIKCLNSYGEDRFDKGYFYIKYEDYNVLFNGKYALFYNKDNINKLNKYITFFTEEKKDGVKRIHSRDKISVADRRRDKRIISLAIRTVWKMNITEEMKNIT